LTGEGQGEGEESRNFKKLFIPLPFIPSHQGRGNFTFYDFINREKGGKCNGLGNAKPFGPLNPI
jgi:prepilin-type processing-associated H-X9-DG protein